MIIEIKFKDGDNVFAEADDFGIKDNIFYLKNDSFGNTLFAPFNDIKYVRCVEEAPIIDGKKIDEDGEVIPDEF